MTPVTANALTTIAFVAGTTSFTVLGAPAVAIGASLILVAAGVGVGCILLANGKANRSNE